jgi:hypothetical protein
MRASHAVLALLIASAPAVAAETAMPAASPAAAPAAATPIAVAVETSHDFGTVHPRDVQRYSFVIRNEGAAPLQIEKVETNCSCTATEFDHVVEPGKTGKVTVGVDTRVLSGPTEGILRVFTNDPANAVLVLKTSIQVDPLLSVKPGYARWNTVQGEKEGIITQTLWSLDDADFRVLRIDAPPHVQTSFRPVTESERRPDVKGSQWHVDVSVESWSPVGAITGELEVVTDHPSQPSVRIPLSGFVRPIIHVTPPTADLGAVTLGQERKATFFMQNFGTAKVTILKAESTVKGTKLAVVPVLDGRSFRLELTLPPAMPAGEFKGALRIQTDNAKAPVVEVPISGTVTKAPSPEDAHTGR